MLDIKLEKLGLISFPKEKISWAQHTLLQPTPILLDDETIRVYCGMRDEAGISRVGFIDLEAKNPINIKKFSEQPVLNIGEPGMFDENGVVPCAIVKVGNRLRLYYAGYQLGQKVRFYVYSGLAESDDGEHFYRLKRTPILERSNEEPLFRVIHSIVKIGGQWHIWYGAGDSYRTGAQKSLPVYNIRHMVSSDGINFPSAGKIALDISKDEHRLGRPYIILNDNEYMIFYGYGSEKVPYQLGVAVSKDGLCWERSDDAITFLGKDDVWETDMKAYPSVIKTKYGNYFFYNGNAYGKDGFGCCRLDIKY